MAIWMVLYTVFVGAWAVLGFVRATQRMLEREGIERLVYVQSTSIAFAATMIGAVAYGILESIADAPALTMWWVWTFGITVWLVATRVLAHRAS